MKINLAEKLGCLASIDLIIKHFLPAIRGHATGGGNHWLKEWEMIREIVAEYPIDEQVPHTY